MIEPTAWHCGAEELLFGVGLDEIDPVLIHTCALFPSPTTFPLYPLLPSEVF
jgi:hypothetical protein